MCRTCAQVTGQERWQTSRHFLKHHLTSKEHLQNLRGLQQLGEDRMRAEAESAREAAANPRINALDITFAREYPKRMRIDDYDFQENDQPPDNYLDDSTFTAGQDFLHDFRTIIGARDPAKPLRYRIVDKFGLEADEVDITASSVLGAFQAKGECRHNL